MKRKPLHDSAPGQLAHAANDALARALQHNEVRVNCEFFDDSDDEVHLWRAWRAARAMGEITPECLALLAPRLDAMAAREQTPTRADQRATRNWILVAYYTHLEHGRSKRRSREMAAKRHGTTPQRVKNLVREHERASLGHPAKAG